MIASDAVLQLIAALLVVAAPIGVLLGSGRPARAAAVPATVAGVGGALISLAPDALSGSFADPPARLLDAALAAAATAILATLAARRLGPLGAVVLAVLWSALVYSPVVDAVVGEFPPLVQSLLGAVDYAGVLATHVALGGTLLVVQLLPAAVTSDQTAAGGGWRRPLLGGLLLLVGAAAWIVGVERVIDDATGRLVANSVVGIALATATWMLVEKIGWNRVTPAGVLPAVWGAWAAIGIGAPFLGPPALVGAAVLGGAAGSALSGAGCREAADEPPRRSWAIGAIGAAATGGVIVALLADGFGLAATGTLVLAAAELIAVALVTLLAAIGGAACWAVARGAVALAVLAGARRRRSPETTEP